MAADENLTTSRLLNKLAHDISTKAATITTASDDSLLVYDTSVGKVGKVALSALTVSDLGALAVPVVVGSDGTGYDVKFFGDTSGKSWLWDESADKMIVTGTSDLLGATQQTGAFTVGVTGTGHDVTLWGDTAGMNMLWSQSNDSLRVTSASATSLAVGLAGATNPAFVVDSSTGSQAAGLSVTGATAAGTVAAAVISSGANANLTVNAKGSGTIGIGSASTGAVTITPATTITGAITPTGGVAAAGGYSLLPMAATGENPAMAAADGTDATPVATEFYWAQVNLRGNSTVTGVAHFNGSVASGNIKVGLADSSGNILATSVSTAMSGTDTYQKVAFTAPYAAKGPATYYALLFVDNNTARVNTHVVGGFITGKKTGEVYATGFTAFTPGTTFTTALGPIATLY